MDIAIITIFVLAIFVGFEIITKVPPTLHTPLMSGSNAISGIAIIGALLATTKIAGDIEDELDFSEIANKIASDDSNSVKLEAFVNELLENNIPCVFVNTKLKLITQIYSENVNVILDCFDNLKVFIREYDYAGDY